MTSTWKLARNTFTEAVAAMKTGSILSISA